MRRYARAILLLCVFAIPWEYSLDFGAPLGNVARLLALAALLGTILAVLQEGRFRTPPKVHRFLAAFFLWICLTMLWSIDRAASFEKARGYFQECMIAWLIWELIQTRDQLRSLLRAWVSGSLVLAVLTVAQLAEWSSSGVTSRFAASGWDPNDTARFLDLGLPAAGLMLLLVGNAFDRWLTRIYFPVAMIAVAETGSRGGAIAALVACIGCGTLYFRRRGARLAHAFWVVPLLVLAMSTLVPHETLARLATIAEQVQGGDLNQRTTIWRWGWDAVKIRPWAGYGAGTFAASTGLVSSDTAHNTALAILVEGGMVGLFLGGMILVECGRLAWETGSTARLACGTMLAVWVVSSSVGTAAESRTTWVMLGVISVLAHLNGPPSDPEASVRAGILEARGIEQMTIREPQLGSAN